jgi:nitrate reductase NapAB chaperone NapD
MSVVCSSLVVHCDPERLTPAVASLKEIACVDVVTSRDHKVAIVMETESTEEAVRVAREIESLDGVKRLELVSHFFEDEARDQLNESMN